MLVDEEGCDILGIAPSPASLGGLGAGSEVDTVCEFI